MIDFVSLLVASAASVPVLVGLLACSYRDRREGTDEARLAENSVRIACGNYPQIFRAERQTCDRETLLEKRGEF